MFLFLYFCCGCFVLLEVVFFCYCFNSTDLFCCVCFLFCFLVHGLLKELALSNFFEFSITGSELGSGNGNPSQFAFDRLLKIAKINETDRASVLHVGDDRLRDAKGAVDGMYTFFSKN